MELLFGRFVVVMIGFGIVVSLIVWALILAVTVADFISGWRSDNAEKSGQAMFSFFLFFWGGVVLLMLLYAWLDFPRFVDEAWQGDPPCPVMYFDDHPYVSLDCHNN